MTRLPSRSPDGTRLHCRQPHLITRPVVQQSANHAETQFKQQMKKIGVMALGSVIAAVNGCVGEADQSSAPFDVALAPAVPFVTVESELLAQPTKLSLDEAGHLWVADALAKRVVALNPDGSVVRFIGQEGDGPGEFRSPVIVAASDTLIRVIDSRHMAVQDYRPDGTHIADHSVPTPLIGGAGFSVDGRLVLPTFGSDGQLASLRTVTDTSATQLGPAVSAAPPGFDFTAIKQVIAEGRVPDEFRNQVTSVVGKSGAVWLLVQTEAEVRKYAQDGRLVWTHQFSGPEIEEAHRQFFRRNAEQKDPTRIVALATMRAAEEVQGSLWVLMLGAEGRSAVFYLLDADTGAQRGRFTAAVPSPPSGFVVDPERGRVYLALPEDAAIMTVDLADLDALGWGNE